MEREMNLTNTADMVKELDLFDLLRYILRKYKIIAAVGLIGFLTSAFYAVFMTTPIYEATAQLYVVNSQDSVVNLADLQIGTYLTSDYKLVFDTWEVNRMVIENLNLPYSVNTLRGMTQVSNPSGTRALLITVSSTKPAEAAQIANEMAEVARKYISDTMLTEMPSLFSSALEPVAPVKPQKKRIIAVGTLVAMMLAVWGVLIAYVRDDKIKTGADVAKYTGTMPLAVIPLTNTKHTRHTRGR